MVCATFTYVMICMGIISCSCEAMCTYVRNVITLGQGENVISILIADMLVCCHMKLYFDYIFMRCLVVTTDKHLIYIFYLFARLI